MFFVKGMKSGYEYTKRRLCNTLTDFVLCERGGGGGGGYGNRARQETRDGDHIHPADLERARGGRFDRTRGETEQSF